MKRKGFTLIELIVVISIIALLMGFILPSISGVMGRSKKRSAENNLKQIANAYIMYRNEYGDILKSDLGSDANVSVKDIAILFAEKGYLNDPLSYTFSSDALAMSSNKPSKDMIVNADGTYSTCWGGTKFSVEIAINLPISAQLDTTPILWTRGLTDAGTWGADGVFGTKGGYIAFLSGKIKWYDDITSKLLKSDLSATTSIIAETIMPTGGTATDYILK